MTPEEEEIASKFMPTKLFCQMPTMRYSGGLCVFWSKEEAISSVFAIQNQIKAVLLSFEYTSINYDVLVQFWAPTATMVGGRCLLTSSHQPFALRYVKHSLIQYRKNCVGYTLGDGQGVIGRVFQNRVPEFSPNVNYYSLEEHPLRDLSMSCDITRIWAFPVFQPSRQSCVGVLEFLFPSTVILNAFYRFGKEIHRAFRASEWAGFVTICTDKIRKEFGNWTRECIDKASEISYALERVCEEHDLGDVCAWVRCKHSTSFFHDGNSNENHNDSNLRSKGDFVATIPEQFSGSLQALASTDSLLMRVGQGLIGNAFLSDKPYLCRDVTQLSISDYPMAHIAHNMGFTGCITICLQTIATGNRDFVLELYLPQEIANSKFLDCQLSEMLVTLKDCLKSFEAVVGDPRDELFVEVDKLSINSVFESLKAQTTNFIEIVSGALENEGEVQQANFHGHGLAMEEFANSIGIGGDPVALELRGKAIVPENNCLEKKSTAHNQKESSCSYETLKQHFGMKLKDVTKSLGVSRSTVKRLCRENNISRWPSPKRSKVTSLPPIPRKINEPIQGNVALISNSGGKGPSSSDAPTDLAPKQAMDTVTVKATYRNEFIKFQLSFSSRMIDLVEKVTLRLKLSEENFTIKYLDDDGDHILILCDEDLHDCMNRFRILEETAIKMLIEPLAILHGWCE